MNGVDITRVVSVAEVPEMIGARCRCAQELDVGFQTDRGGGGESGCGCFAHDDALLDDSGSCRTRDGDGDVALTHGRPFYLHAGRILKRSDQGTPGDGPVVSVLVGVGRQHRGHAVFANVYACGGAVFYGPGVIEHLIGAARFKHNH